MLISDWSSDVCSSDLVLVEDLLALARLDERRDVVIKPVDLSPLARDRSEERRVGNECVSKCRSRWSAYNKKKKTKQSAETSKYNKHTHCHIESKHND